MFVDSVNSINKTPKESSIGSAENLEWSAWEFISSNTIPTELWILVMKSLKQERSKNSSAVVAVIEVIERRITMVGWFVYFSTV